jgi:hypothetical protein
MKYCIINDIGLFLTEFGTWVDQLRVYCCMSHEKAMELIYKHDITEMSTIKPVIDVI